MPSGIFLQLEVDFDEDESVAKLARYTKQGEARACRDLLVAMWRHCKRRRTDGHVPLEVVGKLAYPDSTRIGLRDADRLVECGIAERTDSGYFLPGFLKHNKSREQLDADAEARADEGSQSGSYGNHVRWHVKRGKTAPDCGFCIGSRSGRDRVTPIGSDRGESLIGIDRDRPIDTDRHTAGTERGQRNETLRSSAVTERPEDARCTDHDGVLMPPACRGCMIARETAERQAVEAKRHAAEARRNCRRCHGSSLLEDAAGKPIGKCDHRPLAAGE